MIAYSVDCSRRLSYVAFTAFPFDGIAAARFYTARTAAMQVGASP